MLTEADENRIIEINIITMIKIIDLIIASDIENFQEARMLLEEILKVNPKD
jgi:hypothetical protein